MTYVKQGILRGNAPLTILSSPHITSNVRALLVRQLPPDLAEYYAALSPDLLVYPIFYSAAQTIAQLVLQRVSSEGDLFTETITLSDPSTTAVLAAVNATVGFRAVSADGYLQVACADSSDVELRVLPSSSALINVASATDPVFGLFKYTYVSNDLTSPDPRSFAYRGQVAPSPSRYDASSTAATSFIYKNEDRTSAGINRSLQAISENAEIAYSRVTAERFETVHIPIAAQSATVLPGQSACVWIEDVNRSDYYGAVAISSETLRVQVPSAPSLEQLYVVLDSDNAPSLRANRAVDLSDPQGSDADLFGQDVVVSQVYTSQVSIPQGPPDYSTMHLVTSADYASDVVLTCGFVRIDAVTVRVDLPVEMSDLHENMPVRLRAASGSVSAEVDFVAGERVVSLRMREGQDRAFSLPDDFEAGDIDFLRGHTNTHSEIVVLKFQHRIRVQDANRRSYKISVRAARRLADWDASGDHSADVLDPAAVLEAIKRTDSPLRFDLRGTPITNLHTLRSTGAFGNNFIGLEKMSSTQLSNNFLTGDAGLNDLFGLSPLSKLLTASGAPLMLRRHRLPMTVRAASGLMNQNLDSPAANAAKTAYALESFQYTALDYSFRRAGGVTGVAQYQPASGLLYTTETAPFVPEDEGRIMLVRGRTLIGQRELDRSDYVAVKQFISNKRVTVESVSPHTRYEFLSSTYAVDFFFVDLDVADRMGLGSAIVSRAENSVTFLSPEGGEADISLRAITAASPELHEELSETSNALNLSRAFSALLSVPSGDTYKLRLALGYFPGTGTLVNQIDGGRFAQSIIPTGTPLGLFDHARVLRKLGIPTSGGSVTLTNAAQTVSSYLGGVTGQATWAEGQFGAEPRYVYVRGSVSYFDDASSLSDTSSKPTHVKYSGWYRCTDVAIGVDGRIYIDIEPLVPISDLYSHSDFSESRFGLHTVVPLCVCTFFAPSAPSKAWSDELTVHSTAGGTALVAQSAGSIVGDPAAEVLQGDSATAALSVQRSGVFGGGGYLSEVYRTLRIDLAGVRDQLDRGAPALRVTDAGGAVDVAREISRSYGVQDAVRPFASLAIAQPALFADGSGALQVAASSHMKPAAAFLKPQVDVSTEGDSNGSQLIREPAVVGAAYSELGDIGVQLRGAVSAAAQVTPNQAQRARWRAPQSFNGVAGQPVETIWAASANYAEAPDRGYDQWDRDSMAVHAAGDVHVERGVLCVGGDLKSNADVYPTRRASGVQVVSGVGSHLVPVSDAGLQPTVDPPRRTNPTFVGETPDTSYLPVGYTANDVLARVQSEKFDQARGKIGFPTWADRAASPSASRVVVAPNGSTAIDDIGFYSNRLRLGEHRVVWTDTHTDSAPNVLASLVGDTSKALIIAGSEPATDLYLPSQISVVPADIGRAVYVWLQLTSAGVGSLFNGQSVPAPVEAGDYVAGVRFESIAAGSVMISFSGVIVGSQLISGQTRYKIRTPDLRETLFRSDVGGKWAAGTSAVIVKGLGRRWDLSASEVTADVVSVHSTDPLSPVYEVVRNSRDQHVATMPASEQIRLASGTSGAVFRTPVTVTGGLDADELFTTDITARGAVIAETISAGVAEIDASVNRVQQGSADTVMDASLSIAVPLYGFGVSNGFAVDQSFGGTVVRQVEPYVSFDLSSAALHTHHVCEWSQSGTRTGLHTLGFASEGAGVFAEMIFSTALSSVTQANYAAESYQVYSHPTEPNAVICAISRGGSVVTWFVARPRNRQFDPLPRGSKYLLDFTTAAQDLPAFSSWANSMSASAGMNAADVNGRYGFQATTEYNGVPTNASWRPFPLLNVGSYDPWNGNPTPDIRGMEPLSVGRFIYAPWNHEIGELARFFPSQYVIKLPNASLSRVGKWVSVSLPTNATQNPTLGTRSTRYGLGVTGSLPRSEILSAGSGVYGTPAIDRLTEGRYGTLGEFIAADTARYGQFIPIPGYVDASVGNRWLSSQSSDGVYSQLQTELSGVDVVNPAVLAADVVVLSEVEYSNKTFTQLVELRDTPVGSGFAATYACVADSTLLSGCRWAQVR